MTLGELIKKYRTEHGQISQRQFAAKCSLSNGCISMLEKGINPHTGEPITPTIPVLKKVADGMEISLSELLTIADDINVNLSDSYDISAEHSSPNIPAEVMSVRAYTTALRLKQYMDLTGDRQVDILRKVAPYAAQVGVRIGKPDISMYLSGKMEPKKDKIHVLAHGLNISEAWLMGYDVPMSRSPLDDVSAPTITTSAVLCGSPNDRRSILGLMDGLTVPPQKRNQNRPLFLRDGSFEEGDDAYELKNWQFDALSVTVDHLNGQAPEDFFVLRATDDSMSPLFLTGDRILFLKQDTLDKSNDVAAFVFNNVVTVRRIRIDNEFDWIWLNAANHDFHDHVLDKEDREYFKILGIPKFVARDL